MKFNYIYLLALISFCACQQGNGDEPKSDVPKSKLDTIAHIDTMAAKSAVPELTYSFVKKKDWLSLKDSFEGAKHLDILIAINRVDSGHIKRLDSILVPSNFNLPLAAYLPFPEYVDNLKEVKKMLIFSNSFQAFGAYEYGKLVHVGQTNSGKRATPTPPKLYFCNWKAKQTISTVNRAWKLNWNFNVSNFGGIGFHEYALPGYPASHSCMRLQRSDAFFLYYWAEQWILEGSQELAKGTPVLVYGKYPFGEEKPWYQLARDPKALNYTADSLAQIIAPHLESIMAAQSRRAQIVGQANQETDPSID